MISDERTAIKLLGGALQKAVAEGLAPKTGLAFSGGVDSSLISALARSDITLYSVGFEGSHDLQHAQYAAEVLGLNGNLHAKIITQKEIEEHIPDVIRSVKGTDPMAVEIGLPLFIAAREAHKDGMKAMLSGQGADELFAGYQRYIRISEKGYLADETKKDVKNLVEVGIDRDRAVASANSIELRTPYLDRNVIEIGLQIAPELKIRKKDGSYMRKYILRRVAENIIPHELAWMEKKAIQYGTGVHRELGRLAKSCGFRSTGCYLASLAQEVI
ncbi:MAG: asparagine synthase C-terminal domain-containing protein [Methanocellales archaeon]|nr:asparagine synthase C-terminal domain-containing protein [Methanocellales archaeon]